LGGGAGLRKGFLGEKGEGSAAVAARVRAKRVGGGQKKGKWRVTGEKSAGEPIIGKTEKERLFAESRKGKTKSFEGVCRESVGGIGRLGMRTKDPIGRLLLVYGKKPGCRKG